MNSRIEGLIPEFVDAFPASMLPGVLYISIAFNTAGHRCACGCGHEVISPLSPAQWAFTYNGQDVSLWPSIGNWDLPCQSHYIVEHGRIRWSRKFSAAQVERNKDRDKTALERFDQGRDHDD